MFDRQSMSVFVNENTNVRNGHYRNYVVNICATAGYQQANMLDKEKIGEQGKVGYKQQQDSGPCCLLLTLSCVSQASTSSE